jgi:hypothetical protein
VLDLVGSDAFLGRDRTGVRPVEPPPNPNLRSLRVGPTVDVGPFDFDVSLVYPSDLSQPPYINVAASLVIPNSIPIVGGKSFDLGSFNVSLGSINASLPINFSIGIASLSGSVAATLDSSTASVSLGGGLSINAFGHSIYNVPFSESSFQYGTPFSIADPPWSRDPTPLDAGAFQRTMQAGVAAPFQGPQSLDNSPAAQAFVEGLFQLFGVADITSFMTAQAQRIAAALPASIEHAGPPAPGGNVPDLLMALGVSANGGIGIGGGLAGGFYWTIASGQSGLFGSVSDAFGLLAGGGLSAILSVYWPDAGQTALTNFSGFNASVSADVTIPPDGAGVTVGTTVSWPAAGLNDQPISFIPCGVTFQIGASLGIPVEVYITNSDTFIKPFSP